MAATDMHQFAPTLGSEQDDDNLDEDPLKRLKAKEGEGGARDKSCNGRVSFGFLLQSLIDFLLQPD